MSTAFFWDEQSFWHGGGNYVFTVPVGGLVQPSPTASLPESPETKRRLKNLMDVTGLSRDLDMRGADPATRADLDRGGELGRRTPFGPGGYELAALSAGLAKAAVRSVLMGTAQNAYALSRPPGHHCLPDWPNGFCLLNNIAIAIESAMADGLCKRVAVVDWDVHHGNGTEAIFLDRDDVLAISLHQERNYPLDTGAGHVAYLDAFDRIVLPALDAYKPDLIIVACGYDASILDPLSQTLATSQTFRDMTARIMGAC
ncbi:Histone deacetylase-like amidohydrolase [Nymphon striatum]|nr:Histone deacetylase-like amidohydrolase [Nymphon striatum]